MMKYFTTLFIGVALIACTKKQPELVPEDSHVVAEVSEKNQSVKEQAISAKKANEVAAKKSFFTKEQREAIYFAGSLEKEITKIITKKTQDEVATLLSVLSYIVETHFGVKKYPPNGLDCTRFQLKESAVDVVSIYKTCLKSPIKVADITKKDLLNHLNVRFYIKEWASLVGLSTSITGSDVLCDLTLSDKKLSELSCQNWSRSMGTSEELRLSEFYYSRKKQNQFKAVGGFYKDLVEFRKVTLTVPLAGKVQVLEKELEVRDDFANEAQGLTAPTSGQVNGQASGQASGAINSATQSGKTKNVKENEYLKLNNGGMNHPNAQGVQNGEKENPQQSQQEINPQENRQQESYQESQQQERQSYPQENDQEGGQIYQQQSQPQQESEQQPPGTLRKGSGR